MEDIKEAITLAVFGHFKNDGICVFCGSNKTQPKDFNDNLSRKEWKISRLCQKCQDKIFADPEE